MKKIDVSVVMGSTSDLSIMDYATDLLKKFGVPFEVRILSAHRSPDDTVRFAKGAARRGIKVIIAGAGGAAHLAGVIAANTTLPVIGVPLAGSELRGIDALYSIVQMPAGIPVASMAVGTAGAKNAAYLAAEILGLKYEVIARAYEKYRSELQGGTK